MFSITTILDGYLIDIFQAFTPMIIIEKDDVATIEWTILKEITQVFFEKNIATPMEKNTSVGTNR